MAATLVSPRAPARQATRAQARTSILPHVRHFVFEDVSWAFYEQALREVGNGATRLTFDDGRLEVMSPLPEHEVGKKAVGRLVEQLTLTLEIPVASLGSTTFRRKDKRKGFEPDECYYFRNEERMRGRRRLNLKRDPPPDLIIEVDITSPSVPREPIFAALGVPEVWRTNGRRVQCLHLVDGEYVPRRRSLSLPFLEPAQLQPFVALMATSGETAALLRFIKWVRRQGWSTAN